MKYIILVFTVLFTSLNAIPQNLVQNNSFESSTPNDFNKWFSNAPYETEFLFPTNTSIYFPVTIKDIFGGYKQFNNLGIPGYDDIEPVLNVPENYFGYEYPFDGNKYMGLYAYKYKDGSTTSSSERGFIGIKLTESLIKDVTYVISFRVSKMDNNLNKEPKISVLFSKDINNNNKPVNEVIIEKKRHITKTGGWEKIYIEYTPETDDLTYLFIEMKNTGFLYSEFACGVYIDEVLVIDKCTYDGMNCYTVSGPINPKKCNNPGSRFAPVNIANLQNVTVADIEISAHGIGLVDKEILRSNQGLIHPYYWENFLFTSTATVQYSFHCIFKNLCYEKEIVFNVQQYSNMDHFFSQIIALYNDYKDYGPYPLISGCEPYTYLYKFNFNPSKPFYYSTNSIFAGQDVLVKNGDNITFQAEKRIVMAEGFRVERGAKFHALLSPMDINCEKDSMHSKNTNKINSNIGKQDLIIYPNPTNNEIRIQVSNTQTQTNRIEIIDINGKMLDVFLNCSNSTLVDVSKYQSGIYFVRFIGNKTTLISQFIKQ